MTYCTNKLYGLMFARELAVRLKVRPAPKLLTAVRVSDVKLLFLTALLFVDVICINHHHH